MRKVISTIILRNKEILLFKKDLTWILPGGKPNERESDITCLLREFNEEASGAEIIVRNYYGRFIGITPHKKDIVEAFVYFSELKNPKRELIPSAEIKEIRFADYLRFENLNVSDITKKVAINLMQDKYF